MVFSFWKDSAARPDDAADAWFTPGRFAILLCLFVVATFPALIVGDTFVYRDFGYVTIPFAKFMRDSFSRGEFPLWNPLNMCGLPFLGQWGTQALYPPALLYVIFPLVWAVNIFCLAHIVLGGLGMYHLVTHWTNDRFAASVAGVAFAFSAVFLNCITWVHSAAALGWMPWVVLAMERCWQGRKRTMLVASMAGAMQMLSGAPEIILQTWLIVAALAGAHLLRAFLSKAPNPLAIPLRLAGVVLFVVALTAAQLLPFLDMLSHSQRSGNYGGSAWAMPSWGWANFLVPLFNNQLSTAGVFSQFGQYWISSHYLGAGVFLLAIFAVWKIRQPQVWLFGGIVLFSLAMALGENSPVYGWVRSVIPLGFMRYPVKFVITAAFLVPVLAALAMTQFEFSTMQPRRSKSLMVMTGAALLAIGLILWHAHQVPMPASPWAAIWKNGLSRAVLLLALISLAAALPKTPVALTRSGIKLIILAVILLDLITHAPNAFPVVDATVYEPGLAERQLSKLPKLGESRAMLTAEANYFLYSKMISEPAKDFLVHRAGLYSNCNLLDNVPKVDGFNSLYPREIWEVLAPIYIATNGYPPRLADFMGASQITEPGEVFKWQARTSNLPLITAGQKIVFTDTETTLREIHQPGFDGREVVYLPAEAKSSIIATQQPDARVTASSFQTHRVEASVQTPQPAIVVISQSYYHWWRAEVNGRPVPLWHANHGFQALEVPAGQSKIELIYDDRGFRAGLIISGLSWLICIGSWLSTRRRSHNPSAT